MTEDAIDQLLGQINSLALTLSAVITALPPAQAAAAGRQLRATLDVEREQENAEGSSGNPKTVTRDAVVEVYLQLLGARASHD